MNAVQIEKYIHDHVSNHVWRGISSSVRKTWIANVVKKIGHFQDEDLAKITLHEITQYVGGEDIRNGTVNLHHERDWVAEQFREMRKGGSRDAHIDDIHTHLPPIQDPDVTFGGVTHTRACKRCGDTKEVTVMPVQRRKSDEAITFVMQCGKCDHQWQES